jgi:O-antigen/teichoic acid export membrane protein
LLRPESTSTISTLFFNVRSPAAASQRNRALSQRFEPHLTAPEERGHDLSSLVIRGVGWMTLSQGAIQVLAFVTSVVIARFLTPLEVGLAAEALVFASLALVIVDFGFAAVIVQRPALSEDDKSTAFWAGTFLGVILTLAGVAASWPIAALYGEPDVQPLFAVLSLAFLFTAPGIVQGALLTRDLEFRSLELRTIVATALSCFAGITLAVAGAGPWAIVGQDLVITSVSTLLLWRISDWRPRWRFSMRSLRGMAGYTGNVFGSRALAWGTINLDNFLIGRFVGAAPLGAYTLAFSVMITPVNRIATPVTQVFFPAFSRLRDRARVAAMWLRAIRMVALVVVPLMLGLIVVAPDFVHALFGRKWNAAIPVIQILAPVGLIQALAALNGGILQALDRTKTLFRFTALISAATVIGFAAGLPWGIEGVAVGYLVVTLILQPVFLKLTTDAAGVDPLDWLRSVWGVTQSGIAMMLVVLGARELLLGTSVPVGGRLALLVVLGAVVYAFLVWWRDPLVRVEFERLRERRRRDEETPLPRQAELPDPAALPPSRDL